MVTNGVQGVLVTITHPTGSMLVISTRYLVFVNNDGIPTILIDNNYFYNGIRT
jgi:hypothetical protein